MCSLRAPLSPPAAIKLLSARSRRGAGGAGRRSRPSPGTAGCWLSNLYFNYPLISISPGQGLLPRPPGMGPARRRQPWRLILTAGGRILLFYGNRRAFHAFILGCLLSDVS